MLIYGQREKKLWLQLKHFLELFFQLFGSVAERKKKTNNLQLLLIILEEVESHAVVFLC